mmetsp:Transcript_9895/g.11224  ORF Transcript_9895/g.11224 Transcript_9895/m.11224 type:complete len:268 (-) Transcript_9895:490-1293(-)
MLELFFEAVQLCFKVFPFVYVERLLVNTLNIEDAFDLIDFTSKLLLLHSFNYPKFGLKFIIQLKSLGELSKLNCFLSFSNTIESCQSDSFLNANFVNTVVAAEFSMSSFPLRKTIQISVDSNHKKLVEGLVNLLELSDCFQSNKAVKINVSWELSEDICQNSLDFSLVLIKCALSDIRVDLREEIIVNVESFFIILLFKSVNEFQSKSEELNLLFIVEFKSITVSLEAHEVIQDNAGFVSFKGELEDVFEGLESENWETGSDVEQDG